MVLESAIGKLLQDGDLRETGAQIVMDIARDPRPLKFEGLGLLKPAETVKPADAQVVNGEPDPEQHGGAEDIKRPGLIKVRSDPKGNLSATLVPDAVAI